MTPVTNGVSKVRICAHPLSPTTQTGPLANAVRRVLQNALQSGAFPGAVAVVGSVKGPAVVCSVGTLDGAGSPPTNARTVYDLASLTKVIATTTAVLQCVERGQVSLDAPVQRDVPAFTGAGKSRVTVRHLLTHTSGLPAGNRVHLDSHSPREAMSRLLATPLVAEPGTTTVYSDVSAVVLGALVEKVSGEPLDRYVARSIVDPLGMSSTRYLPPQSWRSRIAPTETDAWRGRKIHGEVHDETAYALGGVSGNAGLFGSAEDLSRFAQCLLGGGERNGVRILSRASVASLSLPQSPDRSRSLGWELADGTNSAGHHMSDRAFGHTGFTGTSLWVDPEQDIFVLLLSNRVNPSRDNIQIRQVRVALADAAWGEAGANGVACV